VKVFIYQLCLTSSDSEFRRFEHRKLEAGAQDSAIYTGLLRTYCFMYSYSFTDRIPPPYGLELTP